MGRAKQIDTHLPQGITMMGKKFRARITVDGIRYDLMSWPTLKLAKIALETAQLQKATNTFVSNAERRRRARAAREQKQLAAVTLTEWNYQWLELLKRRGRTESTIVSYRSLMNAHVLQVLGHLRLDEITEQHIYKLITDLKNRPSVRNPNATTNGVAINVFRTLRSCFNDAVAQKIGNLSESPVQFPPDELKIKKVRARESKGEVAEPQEVWDMFDAMPEYLRLSVLLAGFIGLRLGEVLGLERRDFEGLDADTGAWVHIERQVNTKAANAALTPPKAGSERTNSIPAAIVPAIVAHLEKFTGPDPESALFPSTRSANGRISQTTLDNAWRKARTAAGRPTLRFHALRATALTIYGRTGATDKDLMERGGHKTYEVAMNYQHSGRERDRALTSVMDKMIQRK